MNIPSIRPSNATAADLPECAIWQDFIQQRCGLHFTPGRLGFLHQRLAERMRFHRMQSLQEYYHYVAFNPEGTAEWQELLDLLLNNETSFFRHTPSFTTLTGHILPDLLQTRPKLGPLNMWSAGCSMGQEVYSLAMLCLDLIESGGGRHTAEAPESTHPWQFKILGSDISRRALHKARQGQYKAYEIRSLPEDYRKRYFTTQGEGHNLVYHVVPKLQTLVEFSHVNLHDVATYPPCYVDRMDLGMDIIFCQNVLIYFAMASRITIVQDLCQRLRPGGYLFLGPAEALGLKVPDMRPVRFADALLYQRTM